MLRPRTRRSDSLNPVSASHTLIADPVTYTPPLPSSTVRLLQVAASLAAGQPVNLAEALAGLGVEHARHVAGAVLRAAGVSELLTVHSTEKLTELEAFQDELAGRPA
jgi:hypothetical protein